MNGKSLEKMFQSFFISFSRNSVGMLEFKSKVDVRMSSNTRNCDVSVSFEELNLRCFCW